MTMWLLTFAVGVLPLVVWLLRSFNEWWFCRPSRINDCAKFPPGHMGWPIFGELLDFLWCFKFTGNPDEFIWKRRAKYGNTGIYRTHLFGFPSIIACSPEVNKYVLGSGTKDGSFVPGWPSAKLVGESSLIIVEGQQHKRVRRYLLEAINSPRSLKGIISKVQPKFRSALDDWASKGTINAVLEVKEVTFANICSLFLSFQQGPQLENMKMLYKGLTAGLRAQKINLPGTAFHYALNVIRVKSLKAVLLSKPMNPHFPFLNLYILTCTPCRQCRKKLEAILLSEIHNRKAKKTLKMDFLQYLMDSVGDDGYRLTEDEVVDNMVSLILGGYESTSSVIMWSLYYISKHPNVLQKLREENLLIRRQKFELQEQLWTYDDMRRMNYTCMVADEVIRLANVSPFVFRKAARDVNFKGYMFPQGWIVLVWLRSLHVDPQLFDSPLDFDPERWDTSKPKPKEYQVFGYGPRICPGKNLARAQLILFLHLVCIDYKWELMNPDAGLKFLPHPRPADGAEMIFTKN